MPAMQIRHRPELTVDEIKSIFERHFGDKYEILTRRRRPSKSLVLNVMSSDFVIKRNAWIGVEVGFKQSEEESWLVFSGCQPSPWGIVMLVVFFPLIIWSFLGCRRMEKEVASFIQQAEEFT